QTPCAARSAASRPNRPAPPSQTSLCALAYAHCHTGPTATFAHRPLRLVSVTTIPNCRRNPKARALVSSLERALDAPAWENFWRALRARRGGFGNVHQTTAGGVPLGAAARHLHDGIVGRRAACAEPQRSQSANLGQPERR